MISVKDTRGLAKKRYFTRRRPYGVSERFRFDRPNALHRPSSLQEKIAAVILFTKGRLQEDEVAAGLGEYQPMISRAMKDCKASTSHRSLSKDSRVVNACGLHQERSHAAKHAAKGAASLRGVRQ
jgi:hypothetical protein